MSVFRMNKIVMTGIFVAALLLAATFLGAVTVANQDQSIEYFRDPIIRKLNRIIKIVSWTAIEASNIEAKLDDPETGLGEIKREVASIEENVVNNFPPAGFDSFSTIAEIELNLYEADISNHTVMLTGLTTLERSEPYIDSSDGKRTIDIEIVSMELVGTSPLLGEVRLTENSSLPSLGKIKQQNTEADYPADSFFDIFIEIELPNRTDTLVPYEYDSMNRLVTAAYEPIRDIPQIDTPYYGSSEAFYNSTGFEKGELRIEKFIPTTPSHEIIKREIIALEKKLDEIKIQLEAIEGAIDEWVGPIEVTLEANG